MATIEFSELLDLFQQKEALVNQRTIPLPPQGRLSYPKVFAIHDSISEAEPEAKPHVPFPRWQPVRCPQCSWHGPAAKAMAWFADPKQYCPSCNVLVVKHEGAKS